MARSEERVLIVHMWASVDDDDRATDACERGSREASGRGGARHEHGSASMEARGVAGGRREVEDEDQEER